MGRGRGLARMVNWTILDELAPIIAPRIPLGDFVGAISKLVCEDNGSTKNQ